MVSDERALAMRLAARDDVTLARTLALRGVSPSIGWHDFFDAAAGLLDAASLDRALTRLPRTALIALSRTDAAAGASSDGTAPPGSPALLLDDLGLLGEGRAPFTTVIDRLGAVTARRPDALTSAQPAATRAESGTRSAAAAAERAFTTAGSLADVLLACLQTPLTRTGAGTIGAPDRKRLTEAGAIETPEELDDLMESAAAAGLAIARDREWIVTDAGERWLASPTALRWTEIASGFRDALPRGLRTASGGYFPPSGWADTYPLDPEWPARAARLAQIAARWGLLDADGAEPAWTASLRQGGPADPTEMVAHLPAEIDRVYLQADLTAIAPGPLAPHLDLRLRTVALRESRAQASTYRFTAESIGRGMTEGETAASIREFLAELSLTGIPQPLDYLIESTAARHGLVRVRVDAASGRTRVESADPGLVETIAIDHALRALGLVADGDALSSRVARDPVYWALADARYPVMAQDESGVPESLHRRSSAAHAAAASDPSAVYARLIGVLRGGQGTDGEAAWLGRELELAVRARTEIIVVVRMPDGTDRPLRLEATGLGGGRLRGRDRAADIERTLPVSSIVSVRPA